MAATGLEVSAAELLCEEDTFEEDVGEVERLGDVVIKGALEEAGEGVDVDGDDDVPLEAFEAALMTVSVE